MSKERKIIDEGYDCVIVGAGVCGSILAKELSEAGKRVLVLEAGTAQGSTWEGYQSFMDTFFNATIKIPNAPFPSNPSAPEPLVTDAQQIKGCPDLTGYFVQNGPFSFLSSYTRWKGGTTLHWLGTCLRMLPDDFKAQTLYGQGPDWPITYDDLVPYYAMAEREIGVSANVEDQTYLGIHFPDGYVYPMFRIPQSYLDERMSAGIEGLEIDFYGEKYPLQVVSTPQGRNSMPNPGYNNGEGFVPVGAVGNPDLGQRCEGNSNCVPICPVQAKYNALKTLHSAKEAYPDRVTVMSKMVVSEMKKDAEGRVTGIVCKRYHNKEEGIYETIEARGARYVLAAHAVENAKIMLASGMPSSSGLVGKNLMDHPVLLTWGLMPEKIGSFRGPGSTSGIPSLRTGAFRSKHAPFRIEIGNWGWNWPTGAPMTDLDTYVDQQNLFGAALRNRFASVTPRQFRFGFLVEQTPSVNNKVTIDNNYRDLLGNFRPVINYDYSDYTKKGALAAKQVSDQIFTYLGVEGFTQYNPNGPGYFEYDGVPLEVQGAGHLVGTHTMGDRASNSVVNPQQRCWDYENLYLTGCGNFPTIATSNPTLTMAALAYQAAENIIKDLNGNG